MKSLRPIKENTSSSKQHSFLPLLSPCHPSLLSLSFPPRTHIANEQKQNQISPQGSQRGVHFKSLADGTSPSLAQAVFLKAEGDGGKKRREKEISN